MTIKHNIERSIDYSTSNAINTPNKMRRHYIISGILLIFSIIDFAVAAPALVPQKRQAVVHVVRIPQDAITMLRKRVDSFDELLLELFGVPGERSAKPESSSAARPSSSLPPSRPADGWTDLKQPLPSIPEEPSPVSSPDHASPSPDHAMNELWLHLFGDSGGDIARPEGLPVTPPWTILPPSRPADGWTDLKQPLPSIPEEPSPVSSPDHASPSPDDVMNELWFHLSGDSGGDIARPEELPVTPPWSILPPSRPADGWTDLKQPLPSIPEEPSPVSSPDHAPTSPDDVMNELWLHLYGDPGAHIARPEELPATLPSSSPPPSRPLDGWTDPKQQLPSIPEEPSPVSSPDHAPPSPGSLTESGHELMKGVAPPGPSGPASSTMSSADHELMGAHALPKPGPSTDSDHETMVVPLSSPVWSTDPERQSMGAESPSGKRRKMEKGLWFTTQD